MNRNKPLLLSLFDVPLANGLVQSSHEAIVSGWCMVHTVQIEAALYCPGVTSPQVCAHFKEVKRTYINIHVDIDKGTFTDQKYCLSTLHDFVQGNKIFYTFLTVLPFTTPRNPRMTDLVRLTDDWKLSLSWLRLVKSKLLIKDRTEFEHLQKILIKEGQNSNSKTGNHTPLQEHAHTSLLALHCSDES